MSYSNQILQEYFNLEFMMHLLHYFGNESVEYNLLRAVPCNLHLTIPLSFWVVDLFISIIIIQLNSSMFLSTY